MPADPAGKQGPRLLQQAGTACVDGLDRSQALTWFIVPANGRLSWSARRLASSTISAECSEQERLRADDPGPVPHEQGGRDTEHPRRAQRDRRAPPWPAAHRLRSAAAAQAWIDAGSLARPPSTCWSSPPARSTACSPPATSTTCSLASEPQELLPEHQGPGAAEQVRRRDRAAHPAGVPASQGKGQRGHAGRRVLRRDGLDLPHPRLQGRAPPPNRTRRPRVAST